MTTLKAQITDDMKAAMRAKDSLKLGAIRFLQAAIKQREVDERIELDDAAIVAIVDKLIKQSKDSVAIFRSADRNDLADKEEAELKILQAYLPERLSEEELTPIIDKLIAEVGAKGPADIGKVLGAAKKSLAGKVDMGMLSKLVKVALSKL